MQLDEILSDLEEHKELSANRLMELEKLTSDHQEALKEIEKLKMDVSNCLFLIPMSCTTCLVCSKSKTVYGHEPVSDSVLPVRIHCTF